MVNFNIVTYSFSNNKHNIENIAVDGMENWGVAQCITDSEEHAEVMNLTCIMK